MKKKLALFDLDGTLFDTRKVNYLAYAEALREVGVTLDYTFFCEYCNGRHYTVFLPEMLDDSAKIEYVHGRKKAYYSKYLKEAILNEHLFEIIECIKKDYYIGLVTTASRENCEEILRFFEKKDVFDLIVTAEDVKKKKPDPEGFLRVMDYYGISKEDTIIFEDSDVGVAAAESTGATVFVVKGFA